MRDPSVMLSVYAVGNAVGIRVDRHVSDIRAITRRQSVRNPSVNVAKSCNFFATFCEIQTGYIPSVLESETPSAIRRKAVGECGKIP